MTNLATHMHSLLLNATELGQQGKMKACKEELQKIYKNIKKNPFVLWDDVQVSQLGKCIIMMLHLDLIEDEEQNIGLAHLAYLFLSKGIEREEALSSEADTCELFRLRKDRIILLKSFDDFFVDSLQGFYFSDKKAQSREEYNQQRKIALSRLPFLQLADIYKIEQDYPNLRNDEFLLDLANFIEHDTEFNNDNLEEGLLLHQILYKYSFRKLKEKKLIY